MTDTHTVDSLDELGDDEVIGAIAECARREVELSIELAALMRRRNELIRVGMARPAARVSRTRMAEAAKFSGATPISRLYQIRDGR